MAPAGSARSSPVKGERLPIWVDETGNPADPPPSGAAVVIDAVSVTALRWAVAEGAVSGRRAVGVDARAGLRPRRGCRRHDTGSHGELPVVVIPARTVPEPEGTYFPGPLL
jgi:hypothetical protein